MLNYIYYYHIEDVFTIFNKIPEYWFKSFNYIKQINKN